MDTTRLANGTNTLTIDAWDSSAGQPFAHAAQATLALKVSNPTPTPTVTPTPTATPTPSGQPTPTPTGTCPKLYVTANLSSRSGHSIITCTVRNSLNGVAVPSQLTSVVKSTARSGPYTVWMSKKTNVRGQASFPYAQPKNTWYVRCSAGCSVSPPMMINGFAAATRRR